MYPAIDVVFYGNQGELEYDFIVAPGLNPADITFGIEYSRLSETDSLLVLDAEGNLVLRIAAETTLRFQRPLIYQESSG